MSALRLATCQFPTTADIAANLAWVRHQLTQAAEAGAHLVHFGEAALSGYAGTDFAGFDGYDWTHLRRATEQVMATAAELGVWVVLGTAHPLADGLKPHNSLHVVDDRGQLRERYDKRFCSGDPQTTTGDLAHYTPGDHTCTWQVRGVTCSALICYDYRFPELHRDLARRGAQLLLHSFHTGGVPAARLREITAGIGAQQAAHNPAASTLTYPAVTMPAAMTAVAASDHVRVSAANSCAPESLWPAFAVRADGITTGRLVRNVPGVLITEVDTTEDLYDATAHWRRRALEGTWHSGTTTDHPRSRERTRL
ncbi:carbon-nitrogen hydrolase family protein [Saccharopolyspora griseoalba]|uniref:Carbon-nitrogen hydrolase family protein n=1 Tax=Saccharopolyspora griseoalba TaxID=1431848 RepID=A0ABW2LGZ7_9PSEU